MQVHKRLLQPSSQQPLPLTGLAPVQQAEKAHVLVPAKLLRVGHEVERLEGRGVELHILGEVVVVQSELVLERQVREEGKVQDQCGESRHGDLEVEFGYGGSM